MDIKKAYSVILIAILLSSFLAGFVSASDSHEDFSKAKTDLQALYASLNRTKLQIVDSLNNSLNVNYSIEYTPDEGKFGSYDYSYDQDKINSSLDISEEVEGNLLDAHDLLKEIKGKVSSYEYVKDNYQPFYRMSVNLTGFSENHDDLVKKISDVIGHFNNASLRGAPPKESVKGLRAFNDASYNLEVMKRYLDGIRESYEPLKESIFDIHLVRKKVNESYDLIEYYRDILDDILNKYENLPHFLTLYAPNVLHPGETYELEGFLIQGGEYLKDTPVSIYIDGVHVGKAVTDENGHYISEMRVLWNSTLETKKFRVGVPSKEVWSDNHTVDVVKWGSRIKITTDKKHYFNEKIKLEGYFSTEAPIDNSVIGLKSTITDIINIRKNGSFKLEIDSDNFSWGSNDISFEYTGNETIHSSSDITSFKKNIPTKLKLETKENGKYDLDTPLPLKGTLLNKTSDEGIGDMDIDILIDGDVVEEVITFENGSYNTELDIDELNLNKGNHQIRAVFEGTLIYRNSESKHLNLYISDGEYLIDDGGDDDGGDDNDGDDDDDKIFGVIEENDLIILIFVTLMSILIAFVYHKLEHREPRDSEPEKEESEEDLSEDQEEQILNKVEDGNEVSNVYGHLINDLQERGIIEVKKGKTHRDLLKDISERIGLEEEIRRITDIFEKAYFTNRPISGSEIKTFNQSLTKVEEEVLL